MRVHLLAILAIAFGLLPTTNAGEALSFGRLPSPGDIRVDEPVTEFPVRLPTPAGVVREALPSMTPAPASTVVRPSSFVQAEAPTYAAVEPSQADVIGGCQTTCCPSRYIEVDGLLWHRVGVGRDQVLALNTDPDPDVAVLTTGDLGFGVAGGPRLLVGWRPAGCSHCSAWELSYFGLYGWTASGFATGNNNLAMPGDLGAVSNNFLNADLIAANYTSNLHNVELNCVKTCCTCSGTVDYLYGLRFLNLNERFRLTGDDQADEGISSYDIDANNCLYGVQIGARYNRQGPDWTLQYVAKAGIFLNDANQSQQVTDSPFVMGVPFLLRPPVGASGQSVAGLGELGIVGIRPLNENWSLRLGYSAMVLGGVALAPNQLDFSLGGGDTLDRSGWIFLHGGLVGLETAW